MKKQKVHVKYRSLECHKVSIIYNLFETILNCFCLFVFLHLIDYTLSIFPLLQGSNVVLQPSDQSVSVLVS